MNRLFLDTSFFIRMLTEKHAEANAVFNSESSLFTNEYVIKEFRRILVRRHHSESDVADLVSTIRRKSRVLPTPSKDRYSRITIRDRSDVPIVLGAKDSDAVLLTFDHVLAQDAKKYVHSVCLE